MRITVVMGFFLPMPPDAGGTTEKLWHRISLEFARRGHEVTVLSRQWTGWPNDEIRGGVRYLRLPGNDQTRTIAGNLWRDLRWSLRVERALPPADITVVNCVALPIWLGWLRGRAGRLVVMPGRMPKGQYRFYRRIDRVLAVSTPVRTALLSENPRLAPVVNVCGCPIDWSGLAQPRSPVPHAPITIGYVGRLHREKGLDLLVDAAVLLSSRTDLPPWRLLICGPRDIAQGGSGETYGADLERRLAAALPRTGFTLRSPVASAERLANLYREIDVFCYPSLAVRGETFGVAVAEAMATGAVPVVSRLPCFADFVRAGENGEFFDHAADNAPHRLADTLAGLMVEGAHRNRLAEEARANMRRYDFPLFAERLLADFSALRP
jgi:glycosyltransferase involved in cell wall biosynthesis